VRPKKIQKIAIHAKPRSKARAGDAVSNWPLPGNSIKLQGRIRSAIVLVSKWPPI
jgi:hypothetical protein